MLKLNISKQFNHIYHIPGSTYYDRTKKVKQWFMTIEEDEVAGYKSAFISDKKIEH